MGDGKRSSIPHANKELFQILIVCVSFERSIQENTVLRSSTSADMKDLAGPAGRGVINNVGTAVNTWGGQIVPGGGEGSEIQPSVFK